MDEILEILRNNCRESIEDIAKMLKLSPHEVESRIAELEQKGVIRGYRVIIHEDRLNRDRVTALIEVKVTPERKDGFDHVARRIAEFPEVQNLHLISGTFDLLLSVEGDSLKEVAGFVSEKLAPMDGVTSTCSHFMLKTYKVHGLLMDPHEEYERLKVSP